MKLTFERSYYLRDVLDEREVKLVLPNNRMTLIKALREFANRQGMKVAKRIFGEDGTLLHSIFIMLDGKLIPWINVSTTDVQEDSHIAILPAVSGG